MAKKRAATKAERERMAKVKHLPCAVCKHPPISDCHHITAQGRRLGHYYTIPLCYTCHRGDEGFQGKNRDAWDKTLENQLKLLEETNKLIEEMKNNYF